MLLGYFGADVIKVEPPDGGDPLRTWRHVHNGTALWWYAMGRNKRCITADLRQEEARALIRRLVEQCDVVVENFRPGRMEAWGLGYDALKAINPRLIMVRISGFGQTGPYAHRPGFAAVAEGMGGLRYVNGFPDRPPARANLSLGDTIGGLHAVLGLLLALHHRDGKGTGEGQMVDVALYESIFNLMESTLPEYATAGVVRERHGSTVSGIVPTNVYPCADGHYIIIGGNADSIFRRLMRAIERADLAEDARLATNDGRVPHARMIDEAIARVDVGAPLRRGIRGARSRRRALRPDLLGRRSTRRSALRWRAASSNTSPWTPVRTSRFPRSPRSCRRRPVARHGQDRRSARTMPRSTAACSVSRRRRWPTSRLAA